MKGKQGAIGFAAGFIVNLIVMTIAVVPVMLLSGGAYSFLTGWEQTFWFQWLYARLGDFMLFSTLSAIVTVLWAGLAGGIAWLYIRRFTVSGAAAIAGSLLYTFSGCGLLMSGHQPYSGMFAVLPLALWGIEKLLQDGRKGWVAFGTALLVLASGGNLVLLAGTFLLIGGYSLCRIGMLKPKGSRIAFSLAEWLLGLCMGAMVLLPALMMAAELLTGTSQAGSILVGTLPGGTGWKTILARLEEIFFPPLFDARGGLSAVSLWLPVLGWGGGFALLTSKKHPLKAPVIYSLLLILLPLVCSLAGLLSLETFGGWLALPLLILAAAGASALEGDCRSLHIGYAVWLGLTALLCVGLSVGYALGVVGLNSRMLAWYIGGAVLSGGAGIVVACLPQHKKLVLACTALLCGAAGGASFVIGWQNLPQVYEYSPYTAAAMNSFLDADKSRMEVPSGFGFLEENWNRPVFASSGEETDLEMRSALAQIGAYSQSDANYALRNLLSVRWKFVPASKDVSLVGYEYYGDAGSWKVYQNLYSLPYGVVYNKYLSQERFAQGAPEQKAQLALKGLVLSPQDYERVKDLLTPVEEKELTKLDINSTLMDCYNLAQNSVSGFQLTKDGFVAYSDFGQPSVVFFSIPYSKDYHCYADGEETVLMKANGGFMAALIPAGDREIVLERERPFAQISMMVAAAAFMLWAILRLWDWLKGSKAPQPLTEAEETEKKNKKTHVLEELLDVPMEEPPLGEDMQQLPPINLEIPFDLFDEAPLEEEAVPVTAGAEPTVEEAVSQPPQAEPMVEETVSQPQQAEPIVEEPPVREQQPPVMSEPLLRRQRREMTVEEMRAEIARRQRQNQEEFQKLMTQEKE